MTRYLAVALLAGCTATTDSRPATADYIALAILAPSCGRAACHASGTAAGKNGSHYTFDTVASAIASMNEGLVFPHDPGMSELLLVLDGDGFKLMPPDGPMAEADIALIRTWIEDGAEGLK